MAEHGFVQTACLRSWLRPLLQGGSRQRSPLGAAGYVVRPECTAQDTFRRDQRRPPLRGRGPSLAKCPPERRESYTRSA